MQRRVGVEVEQLDAVRRDPSRRGSASPTVSPSLTRNSSPSPERIAVRTTPATVVVFGETDELEGEAARPAPPAVPARSRPAPGSTRSRPTAGACEAEQVARLSGRSGRTQPFVQARDFGGERRAGLHRPPSAARRRPPESRAGGDVAAAASHAATAPPTTPSVAVRFTFIEFARDRSTRSRRLCYYSSCTLHRLVLRSIPLLRSTSSPSFPLDSPLPASPASRSPTSMAVR